MCGLYNGKTVAQLRRRHPRRRFQDRRVVFHTDQQSVSITRVCGATGVFAMRSAFVMRVHRDWFWGYRLDIYIV